MNKLKNWSLALASVLVILFGIGFVFGWMNLFVFLTNMFMLLSSIVAVLAMIFCLPYVVFKGLYRFGFGRFPLWIASVASTVPAGFLFSGMYWLFYQAYKVNPDQIFNPYVISPYFIAVGVIFSIVYGLFVVTWSDWKRK